MKLALIRRNFCAVGGAELYVQRLLEALVATDHEIHLFAETWKNPPASVNFHPVRVAGSRARRITEFAHAVRASVLSESFDCVFSLERTLKQDVYRAGDGVHRMWLQRRKQFSPWWRTIWLSGFHRAMLKLEAQTFDRRNTRFIIANSEMVRREIVATFGFPEKRIILVRNGIDVDRFRRGDRDVTRAQYGLGANDFVCLFVGSGWERKGLSYAIKAMGQAQDLLRSTGSASCLKLVVVGKGHPPLRARNIIYAGSLRDVEHIYAAADLFTFVPIYEPSANVCAEALAAGLPVITSRHNGAGELIQSPELGAVIDDPSDTSALAREIARRASSYTRVEVPAESISIARNVRETLAVLERVVREK